MKTSQIAIICLAVIECVALWKGIDGIYMSMVVMAISGLAGYKIRPYIEKK